MPTDLMKVPFAYEATVLPRRRQRHPHEVRLRREVYVKVPKLLRSEIDEVVDLPPLPDQCQWRTNVEGGTTILQSEDRLYEPLVVRDRQIGIEEAKAAFVEGDVLEKGDAAYSPFYITEGRAYALAWDTRWPLASAEGDTQTETRSSMRCR